AASVRARAERALREGRTQQALELAKQLCKSEPTPPHHDLLRRAYLARARQLPAQGAERDAARGLGGAAGIEPGEAGWPGQGAREVALCGAPGRVVGLAARATGEAADRLLAHAADAALRQGAAGREALPEPLRADFDRVAQAFAHSEAGRDEAAREALAGV